MGLTREVRVESDLLRRALAREDFLLFDGGMGTLVQQAGLAKVHENPDVLNLTHPDEIAAIQHQYVEAAPSASPPTRSARTA